MAVHKMGHRIKKRRESLKMPSYDLAKAIGVTSSLISQIERGKAYPSILTLKKIGDALNTTVGELIGEYEMLITNPLLKVDERKYVKKNETGATLYLLSHHDPSKHMDPFLIQFSQNADSTDIMTTKHPRQEFCYVLKGRFEVQLNGKTFEINESDSFYFNSNQDHLFINRSNQQAQLLWVVNHNNS
ncbi:MAG: XRE family transcriptional regulator [Bacteroidales bacterium]